MAMFGRSSGANYDPSKLSKSDKLMLFGAMMRDVGSGLGGQDANALLNTQAVLAQRQQQATKQELLGQIGGMIGGQYRSTIGEQVAGVPGVGQQPDLAMTGPVPMSDPRWSQIALQAKGLGVDLGDFLEVQKMNKPEYVNGMRVTPTDPNAPAFIPTLDRGQAPVMEGGQIAGVRNLPGAVQSSADMAGAVAGAQEAGKAAWDLVAVPQMDGSTKMMPRSIAASMLANGGQGAPPGFGVSQTPGARAAVEASGRKEGEAGAQARIDYPTVASRAEQNLAIIDGLLKNPDLGGALGWHSVYPAVPNSKRVGVEAKLDQLQGNTFLQAYNDLKGAGQITEVEGAKAEAAIARLKRRDQSLEDYKAALTDLRSVIGSGVERSRQRASMGGGGSSAATAPPRAQRPTVEQLKALPPAELMALARKRGLIP